MYIKVHWLHVYMVLSMWLPIYRYLSRYRSRSRSRSRYKIHLNTCTYRCGCMCIHLVLNVFIGIVGTALAGDTRAVLDQERGRDLVAVVAEMGVAKGGTKDERRTVAHRVDHVAEVETGISLAEGDRGEPIPIPELGGGRIPDPQVHNQMGRGPVPIPGISPIPIPEAVLEVLNRRSIEESQYHDLPLKVHLRFQLVPGAKVLRPIPIPGVEVRHLVKMLTRQKRGKN